MWTRDKKVRGLPTYRGRGLETKRSRVIRPIEVVDMTQESQRSFERFFDF